MPKFSEKSRAILDTCDARLIRIAEIAINRVDFSVISGHRGQEEQTKLLVEGRSHLGFPHSKHNKTPSMAFDLAPYPIDWNNTDRFILLGGYIIGLAGMMNIKIRWGGNWSGSFQMEGQRLNDYPHFELIDE